VLALGGYLFNYTTSRNEQAIASDNQREAAMKEYFDKVSELMLHENLSKSEPDAEVRKIARVLTLTVLRRLDGRRKGSVIQFLYESGLIDKDKRIVNLTGADLHGADLHGAKLFAADLHGAKLLFADLRGAHLDEADLSGAHLTSADLSGADLFVANLHEAHLDEADLSGAKLDRADLSEADLSGADLHGAKVPDKHLAEAKSLKGATMPDGTRHD